MFIFYLLTLFIYSGDSSDTQNSFQQLESKYAIIYYVDTERTEAEKVQRVIESAWIEFNHYLPISNNKPVQVWIVHTPEDFSKLSSGRSSFLYGGIARPGSGIIVVKSPRLRSWGEDFVGTLRHELVHIFLNRAGLDERIPLWFNEGLAMFLANEYYWSAGIRMSHIVLTNRLIDYKDLDRELMLTTSPDRTSNAYIQSLSMLQYLYNKLGEKKFWDMVRGCKNKRFVQSLEQIGGLSFDNFWHGYRRSLWIVTLMGALATGSIFTPIAIMAIFVFLWIWRRNRKKMKAWEEEEEEEERLGIRTIPWAHLTQEPYDWEMRDDDD
ncbi:MAG: peptidase MA family metallohydrolase [Candidatus Hydrogenedens sp.]